MVEEQVGVRKEDPRELPAWMKLFSGFKVALDPKKLLLAAAGILMMSSGWWLWSVIFFDIFARKDPPTWEEAKSEGRDCTQFKLSRVRWNLLYEMAGSAPSSPATAWKFDAADLAGSPEEYE